MWTGLSRKITRPWCCHQSRNCDCSTPGQMLKLAVSIIREMAFLLKGVTGRTPMVPTLTALRRVDLAPRYKQGCPRCNWARTPHGSSFTEGTRREALSNPRKLMQLGLAPYLAPALWRLLAAQSRSSFYWKQVRESNQVNSLHSLQDLVPLELTAVWRDVELEMCIPLD